MKRIVLEIIGIQKIDGMSDKMEMTTVGTIEDKGEHYIVKYNEEQEPPMAPINVTLKISKDESGVEMTRSGAYSSCLMIEKEKRNLCHYGTEYGDILMGIAGRSIDIEAGEAEGKFDFCYEIDINGALASKNEVIINYRYNQE